MSSDAGDAIHVTRLGSGPRVVLVHGSVANGLDTFSGQEPLASEFSLELVDRRGFGHSPARDGGVDFERDADDLVELLERDGGAHLVGHSYGAIVSLLATAKRPAAVRSLVVIEPPAFGLAPEDPVVARVGSALRPLFPAEAGLTPEAWYVDFLGRLGLTFPGPVELTAEEIEDVRASMTERFAGEALPDLAAIRRAGIPTLVVRGDWSNAGAARAVGGAALAAIAERVAAALGTRVEVVAGAAHNPQFSHPERFNAILRDFLGG